MKDISSIAKSKEVVKGITVNRELVYYSSLFSAASVASAVLIIIALVQSNTALIIYASILLPVFLLASLTAVRFMLVSLNTVFVQSDELVIKSFFITKRIKIDNIEKLTCIKLEKGTKTTVKVAYSGKSFRRTFKSMSKEEIAHLRRVTSKR